MTKFTIELPSHLEAFYRAIALNVGIPIEKVLVDVLERSAKDLVHLAIMGDKDAPGNK